MTELTQPLSTTAARTPPTTTTTSVATHTVSFSELVYAHLDWWRQRQDHSLVPPTSTAYDEALRAFQQRHGEIVGCYWCTQIESAVALTERRRLGGWLYPVYSFHRESDWATHNAPDVAAELHRCDVLAVRARTVLTGVRQRICMQLVMASAATCSASSTRKLTTTNTKTPPPRSSVSAPRSRRPRATTTRPPTVRHRWSISAAWRASRLRSRSSPRSG